MVFKIFFRLFFCVYGFFFFYEKGAGRHFGPERFLSLAPRRCGGTTKCKCNAIILITLQLQRSFGYEPCPAWLLQRSADTIRRPLSGTLSNDGDFSADFRRTIRDHWHGKHGHYDDHGNDHDQNGYTSTSHYKTESSTEAARSVTAAATDHPSVRRRDRSETEDTR